MQILVKTEVCDGEIFWRYSDNTDVNGRKVNPFKISSVYNCWYSLGVFCGFILVRFFHFVLEISSFFSLVSCGGAS